MKLFCMSTPLATCPRRLQQTGERVVDAMTVRNHGKGSVAAGDRMDKPPVMVYTQEKEAEERFRPCPARLWRPDVRPTRFTDRPTAVAVTP